MANPINTPAVPPTNNATTTPSVRRRKLSDSHKHQPLLPGLADEIAQICLSHIHPSILFSVCSTWRRLIYSPSFPPFLSFYALLSSSSNSIGLFSFDPISSRWDRLPPPPPDPPLYLLLRHSSFLSRNLPIQSVAAAGNLIILAATTSHFHPALRRPLIFNPATRKWDVGPPFASPRRWCAAGASRGTVFVASGIGSHYSIEIARSVEKWDLNNSQIEWKWEKMGPLKDGKLSRDAIDAVAQGGKLCMVNVKGDAAKEGAVYDIESDTWQEMPEGMIAGWRGPAAAMDEDVLYAVDESKGALRKYDPSREKWEVVVESERLIGAEQMAAGGGRVCVVCNGSGAIVVVDVVSTPARTWVVDPPPGLEAIAVHVLPRMSSGQ